MNDYGLPYLCGMLYSSDKVQYFCSVQLYWRTNYTYVWCVLGCTFRV